jgi:type IV fimbrial biogenesis protein FimT
MRRNGFTLVELLVVMAIMGILFSIATMSWSSMQKKNNVEKDVKLVYADLMALRLDALYTKRARSAVVSGKSFAVYSSNATDSAVRPVLVRGLAYPMSWTPAGSTLTLSFDAAGLSTAATDTVLCSDPESNLAAVNSGSVDSVVISTARIKLGKRQGGSCVASAITQK